MESRIRGGMVDLAWEVSGFGGSVGVGMGCEMKVVAARMEGFGG